MGAALGRMKPPAPTVLVLGLDNSGKTAVVDCLRKSSTFNDLKFVPYVGYCSVHKIRVNSTEMTLCDVSGL